MTAFCILVCNSSTNLVLSGSSPESVETYRHFSIYYPLDVAIFVMSVRVSVAERIVNLLS